MLARCLTIVALVGTAHAAPPERMIVDVSPVEHANISNVLYLNRCQGGCTVRKAASTSATQDTSSVLQPGGTCLDPAAGCTLGEFTANSGVTGDLADADWALLVQCVREVYSPFDVVVTDERPPSGTYHQAVVAGRPGEIGLPNDVLGIAQLTSNCSPIDNSISFSFANQHTAADEQRIYTMCWTVTQESAHAYGLDHSFAFVNGESTCNDPMTYRVECGGQRFFRNKAAKCGERAERPCRCGDTQNSHAKLLAVFGPSEPPTSEMIAPPVVDVTLPLEGASLGAVVGARAGSQRGIARVQLVLNGFVWAETMGAAFGPNGQPIPDSYALAVPSNAPTSKLEVVARACDDLGRCTDSAPVASYRGNADGCSGDSCGANQTCEDGYCRFPPAVGEIGDACDFAQFCKSELCVGAAGNKICSQRCDVGDTCPADLTCVPTEANLVEGVCFHAEDDGCCSANPRPAATWAAIATSLFLLGRTRRRVKKAH